jgi:YD repeat-containing protein
MKKACFVLLFFFRSVLYAQTESPGGLPQLLPATPDAAQLVKVGLGNINKSSGAVQVTLPLYELSVGNMKLPITLNYLSQGNKVEELCSRVGYGWTLATGGVITRNVMGMPDERVPRASIPGNLAANTQEVLDYLNKGKVTNSTSGLYDTQPDEFYFSFNGHSGKFIINDAGTPEIITHENLKIRVNIVGTDITVITIVTPDGITYVFGDDAYEKTQSDGFYKGSLFPKTSFYLRRIYLTTGENIQFLYSHIQTRSQTGFAESVSTPNESLHIYTEGEDAHCGLGHFMESHNYTFQGLIYEACYISSIQTSTGTTVSFYYQPMPDNSRDVRLESFDVTNQNSRRVCGYNFRYLNFNGVINTYPTGTNTVAGGINGRFCLSKVFQEHFKGDGVPPDILAYDFDYYGDPAKGYQPDGSVYSQDHFGFANGKNNQSLIPEPAAPDNFNLGFYWSDRTPNWNYSVQGVLKKITFPTNGTEEFFYEPNTVMKMETVPIPTTLIIDINGVADLPYGAINNTKVDFFTVLKKQDVTVNITGSAGNLCAQPCDICKTLYCKVVDATTGNTVGNYTMLGFNAINDIIHAEANHTYRVQVDGTGPSCFHATVKIKYDAGSPDPVPVNKITGGVRVKKITKTDPITGNFKNTFYSYAALATPQVSSGVGFVNTVYYSNTLTGGCPSSPFIEFCYQCGHNMYTSNGIYNLSALDNSHVYYSSIVESDDQLFANGGIEYTYYPPLFVVNGVKIRGLNIPNAPDGIVPSYNGLVKQVFYFDKGMLPKQLEESNYETVLVGDIVRSVYIRKHYDLTGTAEYTQLLRPFDVREINYAPGWVRLISQRKVEYSDPQHSMETITRFTYGSQQNILPATITTTNSKGEDIRIERKYPTDYSNDPVMTALQQNYNIIPVVEEYKIKVQGNTELERTKTIYKDWYNDTKVIQPSVIQQKKNGNATLEDQVIFAGYDTKGNITEVSKSQGRPITYCWDYNQSLVTAEIKNAHASDVAYTSFEGNNKGGWVFAAPTDMLNWVPTGKYMYNLSRGAISKPGLNAAITYIISYWSNIGPASVNGTSAVPGRQVKGWTFYQHTVTGAAGTITVSGNSVIDELRLYPQGALMTTLTYEPLVGVTSQCNADNRISYYEYDDLNRLIRIRDLDNNIIKQFDYQYKVEISFLAQWETTGQTRCVPCAQNSNYPSGTREHEEKDININSLTYGQIRWINDGATSSCAIQPDWQNTGVTKCDQEGDMGNSGYILIEQKDMNPCSPSGNSTRLVLGPMNCTVCPRAAIWVATGTYRCLKDANNQNTGYKEVEYKDQETCSPTAGTTKWTTVYDPSGQCYICNTGNCSGPEYKCINGKCERARTGVISSVRTKETGVWKYKCTYAYFWSDCTMGAVASYTYYDSPCAQDPCLQ